MNHYFLLKNMVKKSPFDNRRLKGKKKKKDAREF